MKLTGKATFSKEIAFAQNAKGRFFPGLRYNAEPHLPLLDKKQSVRRFALSEDPILLLKGQHISALPNR